MQKRKIGLNLVVFRMAVAAIFTGLWALAMSSVAPLTGPNEYSGYPTRPSARARVRKKTLYPTRAQMDADLQLLSTKTDSIRTYSVDGSLAEIPRLAEDVGMRVSLGIWISPDKERNEREIAKAIELADNSRSVVQVIVGNEALFREEVEVEEMIGYLDRVRALSKVPVTTAEQ